MNHCDIRRENMAYPSMTSSFFKRSAFQTGPLRCVPHTAIYRAEIPMLITVVKALRSLTLKGLV